MSVFLKFFAEPIWEVLVKAANVHLAYLRSSARSMRPEYRDTDVKEMQRFYAYVMCIENTWGNDKRNMHTHFIEVSTHFLI